MPLSKCRYCGKMIPNIYHKDHETRTCRVMRGLDKREIQDPAPLPNEYQTRLGVKNG